MVETKNSNLVKKATIQIKKIVMKVLMNILSRMRMLMVKSLTIWITGNKSCSNTRTKLLNNRIMKISNNKIQVQLLILITPTRLKMTNPHKNNPNKKIKSTLKIRNNLNSKLRTILIPQVIKFKIKVKVKVKVKNNNRSQMKTRTNNNNKFLMNLANKTQTRVKHYQSWKHQVTEEEDCHKLMMNSCSYSMKRNSMKKTITSSTKLSKMKPKMSLTTVSKFSRPLKKNSMKFTKQFKTILKQLSTSEYIQLI